MWATGSLQKFANPCKSACHVCKFLFIFYFKIIFGLNWLYHKLHILQFLVFDTTWPSLLFTHSTYSDSVEVDFFQEVWTMDAFSRAWKSLSHSWPAFSLKHGLTVHVTGDWDLQKQSSGFYHFCVRQFMPFSPLWSHSLISFLPWRCH